MAVDVIVVARTDTAAVHSADLLRAVSLTNDLLALLDKMIRRGFRQFDTTPTPDDFSTFEELHGLPVGTGQVVFDMLNGVNGVLRGTMQNEQALELTSRIS